MSNIDIQRVAIVLFFAIAFTLIGTFAPVLYASHAPQDNFITVHSFDAQDTTVNSDTHYICFDRTVNQGSTGRVFTELYLINKDDGRVEVESRTIQRYFQKGRTEVITPFPLPDTLQSGDYRYLLVVKMELAEGRVTRTFTFESDRFTISDGPSENVTVAPNSC